MPAHTTGSTRRSPCSRPSTRPRPAGSHLQNRAKSEQNPSNFQAKSEQNPSKLQAISKQNPSKIRPSGGHTVAAFAPHDETEIQERAPERDSDPLVRAIGVVGPVVLLGVDASVATQRHERRGAHGQGEKTLGQRPPLARLGHGQANSCLNKQANSCPHGNARPPHARSYTGPEVNAKHSPHSSSIKSV